MAPTDGIHWPDNIHAEYLIHLGLYEESSYTSKGPRPDDAKPGRSFPVHILGSGTTPADSNHHSIFHAVPCRPIVAKSNLTRDYSWLLGGCCRSADIPVVVWLDTPGVAVGVLYVASANEIAVVLDSQM